MPTNQVKANPKIRPLGPVGEGDKQGLLDAVAQGLSTKETARKLGLSENQVVNGRRKFGIESAPVASPHVTQASEAFASKARRDRHARYDQWAEIHELQATQLIRDLQATGKTVKTILKGAMGVETEEFVTAVPSRDLRERVAALNASEVQLQKIAALEDDQGLARGLSMLEKFKEAADALTGGTLPAPREGLIQE